MSYLDLTEVELRAKWEMARSIVLGCARLRCSKEPADAPVNLMPNCGECAVCRARLALVTDFTRTPGNREEIRETMTQVYEELADSER